MPRLLLLLLCVTLLVSGCYSRSQAVALNKQKKAAVLNARVVQTATRTIPSFSAVQIKGRIDVSVHSGYKTPQVILRGDPRDLRKVITKVSNDTLFVKVAKGYPKHGFVKAEIRGRYLNYLAYKGSGKLTGTKLKSNDLELDIDNDGIANLGGYLMLRKLTARGKGLTKISGVHSNYLSVMIGGQAQVEMKGKTNLRELGINGSGRFNMYWVKGPLLKLRAHGNSTVQLAGVVEKLDVELYDTAHFEGRYLRANRAFVKTFDEAVAKISALKRQHTLASDHSDIYFYSLADMRTDCMAYDGSVLDMRSFDLPYREEYTRLNSWP